MIYFSSNIIYRCIIPTIFPTKSISANGILTAGEGSFFFFPLHVYISILIFFPTSFPHLFFFGFFSDFLNPLTNCNPIWRNKMS